MSMNTQKQQSFLRNFFSVSSESGDDGMFNAMIASVKHWIGNSLKPYQRPLKIGGSVLALLLLWWLTSTVYAIITKLYWMLLVWSALRIVSIAYQVFTKSKAARTADESGLQSILYALGQAVASIWKNPAALFYASNALTAAMFLIPASFGSLAFLAGLWLTTTLSAYSAYHLGQDLQQSTKSGDEVSFTAWMVSLATWTFMLSVGLQAAAQSFGLLMPTFFPPMLSFVIMQLTTYASSTSTLVLSLRDFTQTAGSYLFKSDEQDKVNTSHATTTVEDPDHDLTQNEAAHSQ